MYIYSIFRFNYLKLNYIYILEFYFKIEPSKVIFLIAEGFLVVNIFGDIFINLVKIALINIVCNKVFKCLLIVRGI